MSEELLSTKLAILAEEFAKGVTLELVSKYIAEDCVVHEAASLPIGGDWRGPQGYVDLMQAVQSTFPNFQFVGTCTVTNETDTIAFSGRISGDTESGRFDIPIVEFWRFRDGKAYDILPVWHDTKLVVDMYNGTIRQPA